MDSRMLSHQMANTPAYFVGVSVQLAKPDEAI
jgi:hypothetical protein